MFGNINLDMFVMRKKKSAYIIAVLMFGTAVLFSLVSRFAPDEGGNVPVTFMDIFDSSMHLSFMLLGIFYVMFLGSDIKDGYIKNIAGSVRSRMGYIFSKLTAVAVYTIIAIAVTAVGSFAFSALLLDGAKGFEAMQFCKYLGTMFILLMGFAALVSFFIFFFRSTTVSMVMSIIISGYVLNNLFYQLIEMLLKKLKIDFDLGYISVSKQMLALNAESADKELFTACAVGIGYIVVFTFLNKIAMSKKDIA